MEFLQVMIKDRGRGFYLSPGMLIGLAIWMGLVHGSHGMGRYGYFSQANNSQVLLRGTVWDVIRNNEQTEFSFRTCSEGELLYQSGSGGDYLKLELVNSTLEFRWRVGAQSDYVHVAGSFNKNTWFNVNVHRFLGNLYLNVSNSGRVIFSEIISNSTFRTYVSSIDLTGSQGLFVGREYTGCFMEGVNVIFSNNMNVQSDNVIWSNQSCTQSDNTCANIANGDINDCYSQPCVKGTCVDGQNNYTCICPHLYNGTNCENDLSQYGCLVDTCLNGGTCLDATDGTRNYRCQCVNGYVGINCESDLDECSSNPCQHSTSCIDKVGAYECNCTGSGFTGTNCDQDINECGTAGVCGTNGNCFNNVGSYTCQCSEGFFGPICQDIDECLSNPCQNNGTCQNQLNTFSCSCVVGFTGNQCQTNIDDCEAINCPGTYSECNDLVNGYECVCEAGYEGTPDSCEEIDECRSSPCKNGARCTNLVNDYSCQCLAGYTDKNCQTNINECEGDPCLNGATCIDGVDTYTCRCLPGFDGTNCDNNIDECGLYQDPCFNGGICNDLINDFNCTCATGFMGYRCTININECESNPCGINSIQCIEGAGTFTCECKPGYTGSTCEINIDECESNPCRNGGTCSDGVNSYTCVCTQNWMGVNCELGYNACSPEFGKCKNQATCMSIPPSQEFNCTCLPGFTGDQCQINIDDCVQNSCVPPKVCYDEVNNSSCRCPLGYEGSDCMTDIDECQSNPCQNNARCEQFLGSYTCDCGSRMAFVPETNGNRSFLTGYQGVNCEQDINECDIVPSICLNRGICQNEAGSFQCLCGRDTFGTYFTGSHCEISTSYCYIADDVKNDQPACKNNGTCNGIIGNYTCGCVPGFTGRRCEINIDECESSPCQYNGTCIDGINSYTCDCIPGITGTNCETNIQECNSNPCLNHGECIDGINRYDCNCTDTGFKGVNCEINIDDCESNPCIHGSTCDDKIKDYSCRCFPGYTDKNCETDINECDSSPCFFNSSCHQKSNQTLYDIDYPGFENLTFSYAEAAGYLCECVNGSTGSNCEININDCKNDSCSFQGKCIDLLNDFRCECFPGYEGDVCETEIDECDRFKPCMHRSTCVDKVADYTCNCADEFNGKIYAGKNCSFELTSCANNRCDQGECEPYLINEARGEQDYRCLCHHGYTGRYCNISTTMSFVKASYLEANLNSLTTEVGFRFRTTLKSAILLAWLNQQMTSFFASVELVNGNICIFFESYSNEYCLPNLRFNNADWHTVSLQFSSNQMRYTITSPLLCSTQPDCIVTAAVDIASSSPSSKVHFGSIQGTNIVPPESFFGTQFVGCMEDITVGGSRLTLTTPNALHSYISLMPGCLREEQCFTATCSQHGACVDLWNKFSCDCYRPYLGDICNTEYTAATFAFNNSKSYATFSLPANMSSKLRTSFDLSFFMRSRQPDGLIMFFGSNTQGYVTAGLESGHLVIQTNLCNVGRKVISENDSYSDGQRHLIRLHRNITNFEFFIGDILQYRTTDIASDCFFNVSEIHFGGKNPFSSSRRKRDAIIVNDVGNFNDVIDYKGTIQDVQLNARSLQFFALPDPDLNPLPSVSVATQVGLQESEVTDPLCDTLSPCDNNSTCSDVFFNDYKCDCLRGYRGKNCSDLDFCVTGQCPDGSTCQSLLDGFECQSNATFNGVDSVAIYNHNIPSTKQIMRFSFKFRTLSMNGKMLHIGTSNRYYRVELIGANLIVGCKLDGAEETLLEANIGVNNSLWHMAEVVEESTQVVLTLKDNHNATLSNVSMARPTNGDSLTSILHDTSSTIVVGINEPFDQRRPFYQGCFGEIRIGGILLPFYQDDEFVNNTSIERFFLQTTSGNFDHGCQAGAGCQYSQCRSGSQCVDDYYSYTCSCMQGTTGRWCQEMVDYCTQGDECGNQGHCYSGRNGSLCDCTSGFTGDRCQTDVDECGTLSGACRNGGTCQNENGTFTCNCPTDTLGDLCEANVSETCQQNPCVHGLCNAINVTDSTNTLVEPFNCTCEPGYQGYTCGVAVDNCAAVPCKNGATCTSVVGVGTFNCACPTGYSGPTCADNIDDCSVDICKNGGICVDGLNTYACNCTPSLYYQGPTCTIDIDECEEQQPCQNGGLCVNVNGMGFQCDCRNTGYEGTYCKTDIDECTVQNPCGNGATCTNTDGDYMCNCTEGYEGKNCTVPNCKNINCTIGDCMITVQQTWMCRCPEFYDGKYCDIPGLCTLEPCNATNTIRCSQNSTFSYECFCKEGWEGENCSADEDECETVVCQNGATCVNLPGLYRCDCATGYTGSLCQTDINECASQPCRNGGVCTDLIGEFDCNCNGTGYSNETCQIDVDECLDTPCTNGGACQNSDGNYSCTCSNGYGGRNCEVKASPVMEEQDITWFIVGPAVAVVLILIIIGIVCFVNCVRKKRATRGAYSPSRQEVTGSRVELGSVMKKPPLERLI